MNAGHSPFALADWRARGGQDVATPRYNGLLPPAPHPERCPTRALPRSANRLPCYLPLTPPPHHAAGCTTTHAAWYAFCTFAPRCTLRRLPCLSPLRSTCSLASRVHTKKLRVCAHIGRRHATTRSLPYAILGRCGQAARHARRAWQLHQTVRTCSCCSVCSNTLTRTHLAFMFGSAVATAVLRSSN